MGTHGSCDKQGHHDQFFHLLFSSYYFNITHRALYVPLGEAFETTALWEPRRNLLAMRPTFPIRPLLPMIGNWSASLVKISKSKIEPVVGGTREQWFSLPPAR